DYDALPKLDAIADDLKWAIGSLYRAAGVSPPSKRAASRAKGGKPRTAGKGAATLARGSGSSRTGKPASA
ncbi:MAG TPA: hypothetical protein VGG08_06915, partial [Solirubrobacteraceae bacterium]